MSYTGMIDTPPYLDGPSICATALRPMIRAAQALPETGAEGLGYVLMGALIEVARLVERECPPGSWQHGVACQVLEEIGQRPEAA